MFAQSSLGKESVGVYAPGLIPQSKKILLSEVVKSIQDRPSWPNPTRINNQTSDY